MGFAVSTPRGATDFEDDRSSRLEQHRWLVSLRKSDKLGLDFELIDRCFFRLGRRRCATDTSSDIMVEEHVNASVL